MFISQLFPLMFFHQTSWKYPTKAFPFLQSWHGFWDCLPDSEMWEKCWNTTQQRTQLYTSPGPNPRDTQGHESLNWFGSLNSKSWLARTKKEAEVPLGRNSKCVAHITSLADCRNYVNHPPCTDRELLAAAHESRTADWGRKKSGIWL